MQYAMHLDPMKRATKEKSSSMQTFKQMAIDTVFSRLQLSMFEPNVMNEEEL
jgi:hypothetical protein